MPRLLLLLLLPFTVLAEGFHNNYPHAAHSGFWKWKWEQLRLTWVGHATFLIQAGGLNILTDPQFSSAHRPCRSPARSTTISTCPRSGRSRHRSKGRPSSSCRWA